MQYTSRDNAFRIPWVKTDKCGRSSGFGLAQDGNEKNNPIWPAKTTRKRPRAHSSRRPSHESLSSAARWRSRTRSLTLLYVCGRRPALKSAAGSRSSQWYKRISVGGSWSVRRILKHKGQQGITHFAVARITKNAQCAIS